MLSDLLEKLIAGKWIAGPGVEDAIARAKALNRSGITAIINYLGEDFTSKAEVNDAVAKYLELARMICSSKARADISVKATQLGLLINGDTAAMNYSKIVDACRKVGVFVWLDMEEYELVSGAIALYLSQKKHIGTGICIQSYLKRSAHDIEMLGKEGATIRLVKGAHAASSNKIYEDRHAATEDYLSLMDYLFKNLRAFTIATHDTVIIEKALKLNKKYKKDVTYAMLNGIRGKYAKKLAKRNKVSVYVPFGRNWIGYSYRRIKELGNLKLIIRSLFS